MEEKRALSYEGCSDAELYERTTMPLDRQLSEEEKEESQSVFTSVREALYGNR